MRVTLLLFLTILLYGCKDNQNSDENYYESALKGAKSPYSPIDKTGFERAQADHTDVNVHPHSVHVVYAVPKGNQDKKRDINLQLNDSVSAANDWFKTISNGQSFNIDMRTNGTVDITYWPIENTNAEMLKQDEYILSYLERMIRKTPWYNKDKIYAVYFEGAHRSTCGEASASGGHVVGIYLYSAIENSKYDCANNQFSKEGSIGYVETVLIHELIHALGISHSSDSPDDIMYAGNGQKSRADGMPFYVDYMHDDYYLHGNEKKVDIQFSSFLLPQIGDALPPNWVSKQ